MSEYARRSFLPCSGRTDLYFSDKPGEINEAKEACGWCPVREKCLDGAVKRLEGAGVWGGHLFKNGQVIPTPRPVGRPRKMGVAR